MDKDEKSKVVEDAVSLEEIAEIVEMYIQEDESAPVYDGYDVSPQEAENVQVGRDTKDNPKKKVVKRKATKKNTREKSIKEEKVKEENTKSEDIEQGSDLRSKVSYRNSGDSIKRRYRAVDMLVGISLIAIVFSSGVGIFSEMPKFLVFSDWNGISFGDLGVPVLVMALCFMIPTDVEFDLRNKLEFKDIAIKKVQVGAVIFSVGVIFNLLFSGFEPNFRVMGILQFLGIVYMLVSLIYIVFKKFKFKQNVIGIILVIIGMAGVVGYFIVSKSFGYDMKSCLAVVVDSKVMAGRFSNFERFGIVSTLSAVFAGIMAAAGGCFVCDRRSSNKDKFIRILILGMALIIVSLVLEKSCPYNANIWSPSFVTIVAGGFLSILSGMLFVFDEMRIGWLNVFSAPLVIFGASPIFLVAMNELLVNGLFKIPVYSVSMAKMLELDDWVIVDLLSGIFGQGSRSAVFVLTYVVLLFAMMLFMYGKKIFIRIK